MTRPEFIQLVKSDRRNQWPQFAAVMLPLASFSAIECTLIRLWQDEPLNLTTARLWILIGVAAAWLVVTVAAIRFSNRFLLKCPRCGKCLSGLSSQVVIACGRCGFCGERIVDEN